MLAGRRWPGSHAGARPVEVRLTDGLAPLNVAPAGVSSVASEPLLQLDDQRPEQPRTLAGHPRELQSIGSRLSQAAPLLHPFISSAAAESGAPSTYPSARRVHPQGPWGVGTLRVVGATGGSLPRPPEVRIAPARRPSACHPWPGRSAIPGRSLRPPRRERRQRGRASAALLRTRRRHVAPAANASPAACATRTGSRPAACTHSAP